MLIKITELGKNKKTNKKNKNKTKAITHLEVYSPIQMKLISTEPPKYLSQVL